jgi:hypothetical protein
MMVFEQEARLDNLFIAAAQAAALQLRRAKLPVRGA